MIYILLFLGVFLNAAAQLLLKAGMGQVGHFDFSAVNIIPVGIKIAFCPPILSGLILYVLSVIVWLLVLSRVQVSYAYPMLSVGYIVNAFAAYLLFGENLSLIRMTGIFIIMTGVYLVARS